MSERKSVSTTSVNVSNELWSRAFEKDAYWLTSGVLGKKKKNWAEHSLTDCFFLDGVSQRIITHYTIHLGFLC